MAEAPKDGGSVKDILNQFQSQHESNLSGKPLGGIKAQQTSVPQESQDKEVRSLGLHGEQPVAFGRPSIKQIPKNVVNKTSRLFESGEGDRCKAADSEKEVIADVEVGGSFQKDDPEKPRKPIPPRRPPLAKKPSTAGDSKPRVIGPKPKLSQDKNKSPMLLTSLENGDGGDKLNLASKSSEKQKWFDDGRQTSQLPSGESYVSHRSLSVQSRDDTGVCDGAKGNVARTPGQDVAANAITCLYSEIDKTKKKKHGWCEGGHNKPKVGLRNDATSSAPSASEQSADLDDSLGGEYAVLRVSRDDQEVALSSQSHGPSSPQTNRSPVPPKKPPRTFAHDDYVMQKQLKQQKKKAAQEAERQGSKCTGTKLETDGDKWLDDKQSTKTMWMVEPKKKTSVKYQTIQRLPSGGEQMKSKLTPERPRGRPPPPQRPPPPSPKSSLFGPTDPDRWKKPQVYVKEHNRMLPETAFLAQATVTNPSYEADWNIIRIKNLRTAGGQSPRMRQRCKSDECLYGEPDAGEPIYMDPVVAISNMPRGKRVVMDAEGYAIPDELRRTVMDGSHDNHKMKNDVSGSTDNGRGSVAGYSLKHSSSCVPGLKLYDQGKNRPVQEKLSEAYSVLRLNLINSDENQGKVDDDSDSEVNPDEQMERVQYVSTVKLRLSMAVRQSPYRTPEELQMKLFNYAAIIGLEKIEEMNTYKTKLLFDFPHQTAEEIDVISQFCFPDLQAWRPVTKCKSETFAFVLTDDHGKHKYGYCTRFLPPGTGNRLPLVVCVVSTLDAFMFYKQLLDEIRKKHMISDDLSELLIQAAYATPLPGPGKEAWVISEGANLKRETIFLKRPSDTRHKNISFSCLLKCLSIDNLINVFASVLLERKIIFVAQHLSTLTSCIQALCALLYPFTWPHSFIPVLPEKMIDVCQTPTPIIVGVLTKQQPKLAEMSLDYVLMIDLDHNTLMRSQGDESRIIPKKLQKALKLALKDEGDVSSAAHNMLVMESFLRFFVETIGHYTEYICTQMDGEKIFEKKAFITSVLSKNIRMFLEWFVETQMFEVFITDRMESPDSVGIFEERILAYREEMKSTPTIKQNVKEMGRRVKHFFLLSGDKIKKKFSSNVYI